MRTEIACGADGGTGAAGDNAQQQAEARQAQQQAGVREAQVEGDTQALQAGLRQGAPAPSASGLAQWVQNLPTGTASDTPQPWPSSASPPAPLLDKPDQLAADTASSRFAAGQDGAASPTVRLGPLRLAGAASGEPGPGLDGATSFAITATAPGSASPGAGSAMPGAAQAGPSDPARPSASDPGGPGQGWLGRAGQALYDALPTARQVNGAAELTTGLFGMGAGAAATGAGTVVTAGGVVTTPLGVGVVGDAAGPPLVLGGLALGAAGYGLAKQGWSDMFSPPPPAMPSGPAPLQTAPDRTDAPAPMSAGGAIPGAGSVAPMAALPPGLVDTGLEGLTLPDVRMPPLVTPELTPEERRLLGQPETLPIDAAASKGMVLDTPILQPQKGDNVLPGPSLDGTAQLPTVVMAVRPDVQAAAKGYPGVGVTLQGGPTFAGTSYLYPVQEGQKNIVVIPLTGSRRADFAAANAAAGLTNLEPAGSDAPSGYTWHHVDDYNTVSGEATLELVERGAHQATYPHSGSVSQYEAATST